MNPSSAVPAAICLADPIGKMLVFSAGPAGLQFSPSNGRALLKKVIRGMEFVDGLRQDAEEIAA